MWLRNGECRDGLPGFDNAVFSSETDDSAKSALDRTGSCLPLTTDRADPRRGFAHANSGAFISRVASVPVFAYLESMEVHFTPEQETQLSQIATYAGTDAERLVKDAALRLLQEEARFRAAVREGIAQADRGEFIEEEEMDARLEQMLRS